MFFLSIVVRGGVALIACFFLVEPAASFAAELLTDDNDGAARCGRRCRRTVAAVRHIRPRGSSPAGGRRIGDAVSTETVTTTHCPYCALNCGIGLATEGDASPARSAGRVRR